MGSTSVLKKERSFKLDRVGALVAGALFCILLTFFVVKFSEDGLATATRLSNNALAAVVAAPTAVDMCTSLDQLEQAHPALANVRSPIRVYVGSSGQQRGGGWLSYGYQDLDVTNAEHYGRYFCRSRVDAFFSEHTFEHIPMDLGLQAFQLMKYYLKPGGFVRTIVPDYLDGKTHVPNALDKEMGHVAFYNVEGLVDTLRAAGFETIIPREWQEIKGNLRLFHTSSSNDQVWGEVTRSSRHDKRNEKLLRNVFNGVGQLDEKNQLGNNTFATHADCYKDFPEGVPERCANATIFHYPSMEPIMKLHKEDGRRGCCMWSLIVDVVN